MRIGLNASVTAVLLTSALMCGAPALAASADDQGAATTVNTNNGANTGQTSGNGVPGGNPAASYQPGEFPFAANEGTMAESAKTTALATSTYHQDTSILPGIR